MSRTVHQAPATTPLIGAASGRRDIDGADALRFWAALTIVLFHTLLLPGIEPDGSFWVIRNYGGFGVQLFYTLSAFLLCYGYHGHLDTAAQIRTFYWRRLFRIAPLFYFVGVVYVVFLYGAYGRVVGLTDLLTSATFTFGLFPQHYQGFVWASWSIGVEMLFYAIFPLLLLAARTWRSAAIAFVVSIFVAAFWRNGFKIAPVDLQTFADLSLPAQLPFFCAGFLAFFVWRALGERRNLRVFLLGAAVMSLTLLILFALPIQMRLGRLLGWDYARSGMIALWAVALGTLTVGMSFARFKRPWLAWTAPLGKASFGLYLWHPFLIGLLNLAGIYRTLYEFAPTVTGFGYLASVSVTLFLLVPLALASYHWVERPGLRDLRGRHP